MDKGFTLVEMMIAIFIFVLGMGAITSVTANLYGTYSYLFQQSIAIGEARRGMEAMIKEIRSAENGQDGAYVIATANDYIFTFYSDINGDGLTERVRYFIDGINLKKGVIRPTAYPYQYLSQDEKISIITSYIRNQPPIFHYYNGQGTELPAPARLKDTKMMMIYIVVNVDPLRPPSDFKLESYVQLRNLKTNL